MRKLGGVALIASGLLFLSQGVLNLITGPPPSGGAEILVWSAAHSLAIALTSEVLFFATVCLVPAVVALFQSLASVDRVKAVIGCGIMAVVVPVLAVLLIIHGRLPYPVYGIRVTTPDLAELSSRSSMAACTRSRC